MKAKIHPEYVECKVVCGCGSEFVTRSTKPKINLGICSACHPFFTGKQKFVDSAGRVEKFTKRFDWDNEKLEKNAKKKKAPKAKAAKKVKLPVAKEVVAASKRKTAGDRPGRKSEGPAEKAAQSDKKEKAAPKVEAKPAEKKKSAE